LTGQLLTDYTHLLRIVWQGLSLSYTPGGEEGKGKAEVVTCGKDTDSTGVAVTCGEGGFPCVNKDVLGSIIGTMTVLYFFSH
jgi:hypothetical protein